jgi:epidermal growth factor receptor substrate 15
LSSSFLPHILIAQMSNTAMSFIPSPSERLLVRQILAKADPERRGTFTREVALKAFEDTKLPDAVLHEIWSIADDDNNGWLSERGLAIAVRLLGWAQTGEKVTEALTHRRKCRRFLKSFLSF